MKNLFVGCKVRIVVEADFFTTLMVGSMVGREGIIVARPNSGRYEWIVSVPNLPGEFYAMSEALEPILPEGLLEEIRSEELDLEPEACL